MDADQGCRQTDCRGLQALKQTDTEKTATDTRDISTSPQRRHILPADSRSSRRSKSVKIAFSSNRLGDSSAVVRVYSTTSFKLNMNNCAALIARRLGVVCRPNRVQALSRFSSSAPQHSAASDALRSTADASNASNTSTAASAPASFVGHVFQRRGDATNAAQDASHSAKGEAPMSTREAEEEERSMTALHKARIAHAAERNRMVEGLPVGNESLGSYSKK